MSDFVKMDPLTGQEVYSLFGGEVVFSQYGLKNAASYLNLVVDGKLDDCLNIGVLRGCVQCSVARGVAEVPTTHYRTVGHLEAVLLTPRAFIPELCHAAVQVMRDMIVATVPEMPGDMNASPLWKGDAEGYAQGWRGLHLEKVHQADWVDNQTLRRGRQVTYLKGANKQVWESSEFEATCHGNREDCLLHLSVGGQLRYLNMTPGVQDPRIVYQGLNRRHGTIEISKVMPTPISGGDGGTCMCGIYGYDTLGPLTRVTDNFFIAAQVVGWGVVSHATDGWKASDVSITRLVVLTDKVVNVAVDQDWVRVDVSPLIAQLTETYEVPVLAVRGYAELGRLLIEETAPKPKVMPEVPEWLRF